MTIMDQQPLFSLVMQRTRDDVVALIIQSANYLQDLYGLETPDRDFIVVELTELTVKSSTLVLDMLLELIKEKVR